MNCVVCGDRIEEGEKMLLVGLDGDFMHEKCKTKWNSFMNTIDNMSDDDFCKYIVGDLELKNDGCK